MACERNAVMDLGGVVDEILIGCCQKVCMRHEKVIIKWWIGLNWHRTVNGMVGCECHDGKMSEELRNCKICRASGTFCCDCNCFWKALIAVDLREKL